MYTYALTEVELANIRLQLNHDRATTETSDLHTTGRLLLREVERLRSELTRLEQARPADLTRTRRAISGLQFESTAELWSDAEMRRHEEHDCMSMDPAGGQYCVMREHHRAYTRVLMLPELHITDDVTPDSTH